MPWNPNKPYHPPHIYLDGQVYFISASTYNHVPLLRDPAAKEIVLDCLREACHTHQIELDAWAILHQHYHLLFPIVRSTQLEPFMRRFHSRAASHVAGDTSKDENWNADDADTADDADRFRFYPRPPRRLRSPRPIFGLAIALNKLQGTPGRKVWHNYWDYCARSDHEWRVLINYIHINPIKHRVIRQPTWWSHQSQEVAPPTLDMARDAHELLLTYTFSSYLDYQQRFGDEGLVQMWLDYPLVSSWQGDDF